MATGCLVPLIILFLLMCTGLAAMSGSLWLAAVLFVVFMTVFFGFGGWCHNKIDSAFSFSVKTWTISGFVIGCLIVVYVFFQIQRPQPPPYWMTPEMERQIQDTLEMQEQWRQEQERLRETENNE